MASLNIQLSDDAMTIAEVRAERAGHRSLDAYVESLILADSAEDSAGPDHLRVRSQEHLEELLQQGMDSPAREMTSTDWDQMRRRLIERHPEQKAG